MNEVSLVYFGNNNEVSENLLFLLNTLEVLLPKEQFAGFYIKTIKYGQTLYSKISLDLSDDKADVFLIYRYLSETEIEILKTKNENNFYILPHKYFDMEYIKKITFNIQNFWILANYSRISLIRDYAQLKLNFNDKNILRLKIENLKNKHNLNRKLEAYSLPVIIVFVLKLVVNPTDELKRYCILLRFSNHRVFSRLIELIFFLYYILRFLVFNGFRHFFLMMGFKSFGIFVDSYNFIYRATEKTAVFIFYKVFYFIYYQLVCVMFFKLRHILLMSAFKLYGFSIDVYNFLYKFVKLIMLYPVRKAYWFSRYQYNKRLKKYISND